MVKFFNNNHTEFLSEINKFVVWCDQNFLDLNVSKTKEMVIDFRTKREAPPPVILKGSEVDRVKSFKYLGVVFDDMLNWKENTNSLIKKVNTRFYCFNKLKSFKISKHLLQMFYSSVISGVLSFGLTSWGGNISKGDSVRFNRLVKKAGKIIGESQDSIEITYNVKAQNKLTKIINDETHPLHTTFDTCRAVRSGRFRIPKVKTNRFLNSFVPRAMKIFNSNYSRSDNV